MKVHSDKKPYQCELCQKSFKSKFSLKNHMLSHSQENNYKCEDCGKCFVNKPNLRYHIEMFH
jgi:uncharacterized Zn-finger protein